MAKKDLDFNINADPRKAIQAMAKVVDKQEVAIQKLKKMNQEGRKTKKSLSDLGGSKMTGVIGEIGKIATGFFTAQAAIGGVRKILGLFINDLQEAIRIQNALGAASKTNLQASMDVIQGWTGARGIDIDKFRAQAEARWRPSKITTLPEHWGIAGAYTGAYPGATEADVLATVEAIGATKGVVQPTMMPAFAGFVGKLKKLDPQKSLDDRLDAALYMWRAAGGEAGTLGKGFKGAEQWKALGFTGADVPMAALLAGIATDQGKRGMSTLAGYLAQHIEIIKPTKAGPGMRQRPLTEEQIESNLYAAMAPPERLKYFQEHPEFAKRKLGTSYGTISPLLVGDILGKNLADITKAQREDIWKKDIAGFPESAAAKQLIAEYQAEDLIADRFARYPELTLKGQVRGIYKKGIQDLPISATRKKFWEVKFEALEALGKEGYQEAAIKELTQIEQQMLQPKYRPSTIAAYEAYGLKAPTPAMYDPVIASELRALVEAIKLQIEGHEQERENIDKLGEAADNMNNAANTMQQTLTGGAPDLNAGVLD